MSNAKQLAYALIDALNACGIEEEFSYRFLAEMNDLLRKENKKMEMNNEAKALAGNDKELQNGIVMLMKEYGLGSGEAYELINRLSNAGNIKALMDDEYSEKQKDEEPGDISDVMQDVYTSGETKENEENTHEDLIAWLHRRLDCKNDFGDLTLYKAISSIIRMEKERASVIDALKMEIEYIEGAVKERDNYKSELESLARYSKKLFDGTYKHIKYDFDNNDNSKEFDVILARLIKESGVGTTDEDLINLKMSIYGTYADPVVFSSGEDPGDTHEPSKGSGAIDYDGLISAVAGHLDVNDWAAFNQIIREHRERNKPVEYRTSNVDSLTKDFQELFDKHSIKDITSFKNLFIGYKDDEFCIEGCHLQYKRNDGILFESLPKYKPEPLSMYADGQTPELIETAYEAREAQIVKFANKDIVVHTKEEALCTLSIEEMLEKCYLMAIDNKFKLDDRKYVIESVGATSGIDQVVYVQVKEVKWYE